MLLELIKVVKSVSRDAENNVDSGLLTRHLWILNRVALDTCIIQDMNSARHKEFQEKEKNADYLVENIAFERNFSTEITTGVQKKMSKFFLQSSKEILQKLGLPAATSLRLGDHTGCTNSWGKTNNTRRSQGQPNMKEMRKISIAAQNETDKT